MADFINFDFEMFPYNPWVANKQVEGSQMSILWLVDDLKVSYANSKTIDKF